MYMMMPDKAVPASPSRGWRSWSLKKKLLIIGLILFIIIALAVGLGVGLGVGLNNGGGGGEEPSPTSPPPSPGPYPKVPAKWQPETGTTWQIVLLYPLNDTSANVSVYDIDLFTNEPSTISDLHTSHKKVICYFSAGSWEDFRPDKDQFKAADLGKTMDGWSNEKWINISSPSVRRVMQSRLDLAVTKGCDGVDPDNVDGYDNDNGLDLTKADSIDYMNWLAYEAHSRNMSIGLKNAGDIIPDVLDNMQWSVNEQCVQYDECDTYAAFTEANKPVFHIEYPKGDKTNNEDEVSIRVKDKYCGGEDAGNFSTVLKNMDLDDWIETCD